MKRWIFFLGIGFFVATAGLARCYAAPFSCQITESKIELTCGNEKFILDKTPSFWKVLKMKGGPRFWLNAVSFDGMKGSQNREGYLHAWHTKDVKLVTDSERTKVVKAVFSTVHRTKKEGGGSELLEHPSEFIVTFQIWKDIPAVSIKVQFLNKSEQFQVYKINWAMYFKKAMYTTRLPDGKMVTAPSPDNWHRVETGKHLLIHHKNKQKGIGFIAEDANVYMIPAPQICLMTPKQKVLNNEKTPPFEFTIVSIKQGYNQLEEISKKIKGLELLNVKREVKETISSKKGPVYEVEMFEKTPSIDGDLSDWAEMPSIELNGNDYVDFGEMLYEGEKDLSAKVWCAFDDKNLYFAAEVIDNVFSQNYKGNRAWVGDSIQMVLDTVNNKNTGGFDQNDYAFIFSSTIDGPEFYCEHAPEGKVRSFDSIDHTVKRYETGDGRTIYEAAIPWNMLDFNLSRGDLGFSFLINDNDGAGRKGGLQWTQGIAKGKDPSLYGNLVLEEKALESLLARQIGQAGIRIAMQLQDEIYTTEETINCTGMLISEKTWGNITLQCSIKKDEGDVIYTEDKNFPLDAMKPEEVNFSWSPGSYGSYKLEWIVYKNREPIATADASFKVIDPSRILGRVKEIEAKAFTLEKLIEVAEARNITVPHQREAVALAQHFADLIRSNLSLEKVWLYGSREELEIKGGVRKFFVERAKKNADYIYNQITGAIEKTQKILTGEEKAYSIPPFDAQDITIKNGIFYSNGRPTFLCGSMGRQNITDDMKYFPSFGLNLANNAMGNLGSLIEPKGVNSEKVEYINNYFEKAEKYNICASFLLTNHKFPGWALERYPRIAHESNLCSGRPVAQIDSSQTQKIYKRFVQECASLMKKWPTLCGYDLGNEVQYICYCPETVKKFRKYLREKHKNIQRLNEIWDTNYGNFAEIKAPRNAQNFASWYDWCRFSQQRFTNFFRRMKRDLREVDKNTPTWIKISPRSVFDPARYVRWGVNREALTDLTEIMSVDGSFTYPGNDLAYSFNHAIMMYDLYKSFHPEKPIVDSELHIWSRHRYYPYEYLRAALWQSYLHGASGIIIWHWSTLWQKDKKTLLEENFSKQAEALDAVCKTTMELRKFAKYAGKFSQLKGDVAILYSIPSLIKSSYITTLQKAYLSLFFLDLPVKFITEKQIKAGELDDYKLLLIPGALRVKRETYRGIKDYLKTGGNVLLSGDSLQYDQYNRPRNTFWSINKSKSTELTTMEYGQGKLYYLSFLPSAKKFSSLLDSILDKTGVERKIRVLNAGGMQNAWGVESRTVQLSNGQYLTYVLNLNKEKTKVTITGERKIGTIEDVVRGRENLGCTLSLPSMGISLLKLGYR